MIISGPVRLRLTWEVIHHADGEYLREQVDSEPPHEYGPIPPGSTPEAMLSERIHIARMLPESWRKMNKRKAGPA